MQYEYDIYLRFKEFALLYIQVAATFITSSISFVASFLSLKVNTANPSNVTNTGINFVLVSSILGIFLLSGLLWSSWLLYNTKLSIDDPPYIAQRIVKEAEKIYNRVICITFFSILFTIILLVLIFFSIKLNL